MIPLSVFASVALAVQGQAKTKLGPIDPDRPSFTDDVQIEAVGHPTIEFGFRQTQFGRTTLNDLGDNATVFIALRDNFELHIGIPSFLAMHGGGPGATGAGDEDLGF